MKKVSASSLPTPYKKKVEEIKTDPETNAPVLDADGKAIIEEKEIRIPMFKVVSVFDVSQTAGKPLPQLAADLSGNVQQYRGFHGGAAPRLSRPHRDKARCA